MKFGLTLAETLVPEWRQHYINYDALKYKLKQVQALLSRQHACLPFPATAPAVLQDSHREHLA